jgi:hypothetical protein
MKTTITATALIAASGAASAGTAITSFTYSDLLGSYDANTGQYTAVAGGQSAGDVTRLDIANGSAEFDTGFLGTNGTLANYVLELTVGNIGSGLADANGSLTITDDNGDTLTAELNGRFREFAGSIAYEGQLSNVFFNDISGDGTFDGSTSGAFSTAFPSSAPYDGSTLNLFFDPGAFFGGSFSDQTTLSSGLIIPAPAGAALLAFGTLGAARRRR